MAGFGVLVLCWKIFVFAFIRDPGLQFSFLLMSLCFGGQDNIGLIVVSSSSFLKEPAKDSG